MTKLFAIMGISLAAAAVFAGGLFGANAAFAQDLESPAPLVQPTPGYPGGPMGGGYGWMAPYHDLMHEAMAEALGLTVEELNAQLTEGKTMWQIAEELGIDPTEVWSAMEAAREEAIAQAVEDGVITPEQAEWMSEHMGGSGGGCGGDCWGSYPDGTCPYGGTPPQGDAWHHGRGHMGQWNW